MMRALMAGCALLAAGGLSASQGNPAPAPGAPLGGGAVLADDLCDPEAPKTWMWISPDEIRFLPMSGPQWDARGAPWFAHRGVYYYAQQDTSQPLIGDQGDDTDVYVLAKALVWLRLMQEQPPPEDPEPYRAQVQDACLAARGTEFQGLDQNTLALGRNLLGYVLAANIIDWDSSAPWRREILFRRWVNAVRYAVMSDVFGTLIQAHETRPNNWGLMCGTSRLAAAIYLCDVVEEYRCWQVLRRWLGDEHSPFEYEADDWGELSWQADPDHPVGINPLGARKLDCGSVLRSIDGVLPDDMRRAGPFQAATPCGLDWAWPAYPAVLDRNYNWNALQAVMAQAVLHTRRGRDVRTMEDYALARAFFWLYNELEFPVTDPGAGDDDYWLPHLANQLYPALKLPEPLPTKPGDQIGYADWTTLNVNWP